METKLSHLFRSSGAAAQFVFKRFKNYAYIFTVKRPLDAAHKTPKLNKHYPPPAASQPAATTIKTGFKLIKEC